MAQRHGTFFEPALADRWPSLAAYAESVDALQPGINLAPLTGLGAIRLAVVGEDDRPATATELAEMQRLVDVTLAEGSFGVSSGLIYAPSGYADVDELTGLARVAAARGRFYATHMRNEGDRLEAAVDEALEIGRRSGCAVQISHHKAVGRQNWGKMRDVITKIEVDLFKTVTGLTVKDFNLLVSLRVFNTEQMNQAVFAFRRYEDASLKYTGIESHAGLTHYGLYDTFSFLGGILL